MSEGALTRLRPVLMTALVVVIGGIISSTVLALLVLYVLFRRDAVSETPTMAPDLPASGER